MRSKQELKVQGRQPVIPTYSTIPSTFHWIWTPLIPNEKSCIMRCPWSPDTDRKFLIPICWALDMVGNFWSLSVEPWIRVGSMSVESRTQIRNFWSLSVEPRCGSEISDPYVLCVEPWTQISDLCQWSPLKFLIPVCAHQKYLIPVSAALDMDWNLILLLPVNLPPSLNCCSIVWFFINLFVQIRIFFIQSYFFVKNFTEF